MSRVLKKQSKKRVTSIDVVRGLTIILMLICNNPGSSSRYYEQLKHATWHGVTLADFGFPFFILIMGTAIPIVIEKKLSKGEDSFKIIAELGKRSVILFLLGLILNFISNPDFNTIRILGVLQRLGIVYFITSILFLFVNKITENRKLVIATLLSISAVIIVGYYVVSKPYGFEMDGSLAQIVDMMFLEGHLYKPTFDPEGLFTTIPAIATGIIGCVVGYIINNSKGKDLNKLVGMALLGGVMLAAAFAFNKVFPYNKRLWSSSYVLLTGGTYSVVMATFYLICDMGGVKKIFVPIIALGTSPLFVYFVSEAIEKLISKMPVNVFEFITFKFMTPLVGDVYDSLAFSVGYVLLWGVLAIWMYKKGKIIKI
ncbi:acyltransferase family protein [Romboutsia sp.]|uniref:acyltransferase family protein n=1 Tax=Romboutsia sp. TaxID=1965302 RepID=UPI003F304C42